MSKTLLVSSSVIYTAHNWSCLHFDRNRWAARFFKSVFWDQIQVCILHSCTSQ